MYHYNIVSVIFKDKIQCNFDYILHDKTYKKSLNLFIKHFTESRSVLACLSENSINLRSALLAIVLEKSKYAPISDFSLSAYVVT